MRPRGRLGASAAFAALGLLVAAPAVAAKILFIGNSFTYGHGSAVQYYRVETVTDLNGQGRGGVPALFKAFAAQEGLPYEVALETEPGVGLDWHLAHRAALLGGRPWDAVVMHGYSTLDCDHPGDPALLVDSATRMAALLRRANPAVRLFLTATWPRADQVYPAQGAWHGRGVAAMTEDIRQGYAAAAAAIHAQAVAPVGPAWQRAIDAGVATPDPYAPLPPGQVDLWAFDHYHASAYGAYLEALVVFGTVTGRDPRALGDTECAGNELGLSREQVARLQQLAFDELAQDLHIAALPAPPVRAEQPSCAALIGLHREDQRPIANAQQRARR
ncbi:MAG: PEP-CTERM sorting domain-containing protein [Pelomonas sp.]|nr:PEP-CTERM sorting domain-containing protein [Roseateles sp.]